MQSVSQLLVIQLFILPFKFYWSNKLIVDWQFDLVIQVINTCVRVMRIHASFILVFA